MRDIHQVVRDVCLWFPEAEETQSHGSAAFRVRGKTFAYYTVNHHGDQRVALLLNLPAGAQELHVGAEPKRFFVPAYVGPRGWVGVELDKGLAWKRVAALVREAYEKVAPAELCAVLPTTPAIAPPTRKLAADEIDPLKSKRAKTLLKLLRALCGSLPETTEVRQFGHPVWKAGKKTFAWLRTDVGRCLICVWVGVERQGLLTADPRFSIPSYMGHNGWLAIDVSEHCDPAEVEPLVMDSYRHFALRRMRIAVR